MARNGSGSYVLPSGQPVVTETFVSSVVHNTLASDLAAALTQSISKDGQTIPTGDLPMGGFKHTSLADGTATNQAATLGQVQRAVGIWCGTSGGSANIITLQALPGQPAYTAGMTLEWVASITNTSTVTLNLNGLGAKDLSKFGAKPLQANDLKAGLHYKAVYDGTRFQLLNPSANQPTAVDQLWYGSSDGVWAQTPLTATGRAFIGSGSATGRILIGTQVFLNSSFWSRPTGCNAVFAIVQAGGGGGGGNNATGGSTFSVGSGGGAGGEGQDFITSGLGSSETVTVGAGGTGSLGGAGSGGSTSSFGIHVSASGGAGGIAGIAGTTTGATGGLGGTSTNGLIPTTAQAGGLGWGSNLAGMGAAGQGGSSRYGGGGVGRTFGIPGQAGDNGTGRGAGGGGSGSNVNEGARAGGNGTIGFVMTFDYT